MADKLNASELARQIMAIQATIAAERDKLRGLIGDAEDILEDAEEAGRSLEDAADALSRLQ